MALTMRSDKCHPHSFTGVVTKTIRSWHQLTVYYPPTSSSEPIPSPPLPPHTPPLLILPHRRQWHSASPFPFPSIQIPRRPIISDSSWLPAVVERRDASRESMGPLEETGRAEADCGSNVRGVGAPFQNAVSKVRRPSCLFPHASRSHLFREFKISLQRIQYLQGISLPLSLSLPLHLYAIKCNFTVPMVWFHDGLFLYSICIAGVISWLDFDELKHSKCVWVVIWSFCLRLPFL